MSGLLCDGEITDGRGRVCTGLEKMRQAYKLAPDNGEVSGGLDSRRETAGAANPAMVGVRLSGDLQLRRGAAAETLTLTFDDSQLPPGDVRFTGCWD
jgi:hypothetical protein